MKNSGWLGVTNVARPFPQTAASRVWSTAGKSILRMSETPRSPAKPFNITARLKGVMARISIRLGRGATNSFSLLKWFA